MGTREWRSASHIDGKCVEANDVVVLFPATQMRRLDTISCLNLGSGMERAKTTHNHIRAIDWMRGLSVVVMLECHTLLLLSTKFDHAPLREWLNSINGLVAPTFILAAGFALALVTTRIGGDAIKRKQRARRSLFRIGQVLALGLWMRIVGWSVFSNPSAWLAVDILSCIGYSLLIVWALLFVVRLPAVIAPWVFLALSLLVFSVAPLVVDRSFGPVLTHFLNNSLMQGSWPLVPWSGYALLGSALGALTAQSGGRIKLLVGFAVVAVGALALVGCSRTIDGFYAPASGYWVENIGERLAKMATIGVVLTIVEYLAGRMPWRRVNPIALVLEFISRYSLSAFWFHTIVLFGGFGIPSLSRLAHQCDWPMYWLMVIFLEVTTVTLCVSFARVQGRWAEFRRKRLAMQEPQMITSA